MKKPTPEQRKAASEKMMPIFEQSQVSYVTLSATPGQACANCVFYRASGFDGIDWPHCHLVQDWPEPIEPTGWCERWEDKPEPPPPPPDVAEAIEDLADAISEAVGVEMSADGQREVYITPTTGLIGQIKNALRGPMNEGTTVLKDAAGRRYMFMVTSNGYKDREQEHVATRALEAYVKACWTADGTAFVGKNDHYIWHMKELGSISDLVFADVWSGFLVEMWREQPDNPIAKAFYNFVERNKEMEWGASHGFHGLLKSDTYTHIKKFESSTLPLEAAANLLTLSEVLPMTAKSNRDKFLDSFMKQEFGIEGASAVLHEGPDKLRAMLDANGVEVKALGEGSDALKDARSKAIAGTAETLLSIVEVQDEFEKELSTIQPTLADLTAQLKAANEQLTELREIVNAGPRRAATAKETEVDDPDTIKKAQEQTIEYDPAFPGMKVPLEKEA